MKRKLLALCLLWFAATASAADGAYEYGQKRGVQPGREVDYQS